MTVDLVIRGGQVWKPEPGDATAVAVRGEQVVSVGTDEEALALAGRETRIVDAAGGAILPGFHDGHIHALGGGLAILGCDLSSVHSRDGYLSTIGGFAAAERGEWIVGSGWFGDVFEGGLPDRSLLDAVVGLKPAVFTSHDAHGVWVSSRALELAGIDRSTPDPPAGRIVRDESGEPTGVLLDSAGELVTGLLPEPDLARQRAGLLAAQDHLAALGVTAWHDALLGRYLAMQDPLPAYLSLIDDGALTSRVSGSIWWPPGWDAARVPEVLARVDEARAAGFTVTGVKVMQDGICENCTAALLAPYSGGRPGIFGDSVIPPSELVKIVAALDAAGERVHFHGVGDRAVRECLDAVEAARRRNGPGVRHQIAHLDLVHEADLPRFRELGVSANLQPLWARADQEILERKLPLLGPERARWHFPFGSLREHGAHLVMGSDWPVTSPDPLWGLHTAVTRTAPPDDVHALGAAATRPMQPHERLEPADAVRAYTLGPAEAIGAEGRIGRIRPGHLADLVVLTNPIVDRHSFAETRVATTVLGGRVVHSL